MFGNALTWIDASVVYSRAVARVTQKNNEIKKEINVTVARKSATGFYRNRLSQH
jgi:hypothetical protein